MTFQLAMHEMRDKSLTVVNIMYVQYVGRAVKKGGYRNQIKLKQQSAPKWHPTQLHVAYRNATCSKCCSIKPKLCSSSAVESVETGTANL